MLSKALCKADAREIYFSDWTAGLFLNACGSLHWLLDQRKLVAGLQNLLAVHFGHDAFMHCCCGSEHITICLPWKIPGSYLPGLVFHLEAPSEFVRLNKSLLIRGCQINALANFYSDKQILCNFRLCADLSIQASLYKLMKASWQVMSRRRHLSIHVLVACWEMQSVLCIHPATYCLHLSGFGACEDSACAAWRMAFIWR